MKTVRKCKIKKTVKLAELWCYKRLFDIAYTTANKMEGAILRTAEELVALDKILVAEQSKLSRNLKRSALISWRR